MFYYLMHTAEGFDFAKSKEPIRNWAQATAVMGVPVIKVQPITVFSYYYYKIIFRKA